MFCGAAHSTQPRRSPRVRIETRHHLRTVFPPAVSGPQTLRKSAPPSAITPQTPSPHATGTSPAIRQDMAAVLALIMLPLVAATGFFVGSLRGDISPSTAFAAITFISLAVFVLGGALRIARAAEGPQTH